MSGLPLSFPHPPLPERITLPRWKALWLFPIIACYTNLFHLYERTLPLFYLPTYCPTCNVLPHTLNILSPNTKSSIGVAVRFSKWTVFGDCQNTVTSPPNDTPIILVFLHDMLFKHSEIWQGYRMEFISNIHVVFFSSHKMWNTVEKALILGVLTVLIFDPFFFIFVDIDHQKWTEKWTEKWELWTRPPWNFEKWVKKW